MGKGANPVKTNEKYYASLADWYAKYDYLNKRILYKIDHAVYCVFMSIIFFQKTGHLNRFRGGLKLIIQMIL